MRTVFIFANAYGFTGPLALAAPQVNNAMASVLQPMIEGK